MQTKQGDNAFIAGKQSRLGSFVEAWGNVAVGFGINYTANLIILPAFGFKSLTWKTNLAIGLLYTVISVVRSYVIRRYFNGFKFKWNVAKI